ncbi:hypothetical protein M9458_001281, partial [Cirrhinus mrigala]
MVVGVTNVDSAVLVDDVKSGIVVGDVVVVLSDTSEEVEDIEALVVRGALVFAEEKGVDVGFTAVLIEVSVVEVTVAVVVGAAFVGGSGNTAMVVGFRVVFVEASFVEDCAVVVGAGFSVVGVGNTGLVVGFPAVVVEDGVGAAFVVVVGAVTEDISVVAGFPVAVVGASEVEDCPVVVEAAFSVAG